MENVILVCDTNTGGWMCCGIYL